MKKIMFSMALVAGSFAMTAQQNILISEVFVNAPTFAPGEIPTGGTTESHDGLYEYVELLGTPGETIATGTYLVTIEGDINTGNDSESYGKVDKAFNLGDLTFGSNGYLILRRTGSPYTVNAEATDNSTLLDSDSDNVRASGVIEDQSLTIMLITVPDGVEVATRQQIDVDKDGVADNGPDDIFTQWTILDQIALLDTDESRNGVAEISYSTITFAQDADTFSDFVISADDNGIISTDFNPAYVARIGTGNTPGDWVAGAAVRFVEGETDIEISRNATFDNIMGDLKLDHLGAPNFVQSPSLSTDEITSSNSDFGIYPNPSTNGIFQVASKSTARIESASVYNILGQEVVRKEGSVQQIDLSDQPRGLYMAILESSDGDTLSSRLVY